MGVYIELGSGPVQIFNLIPTDAYRSNEVSYCNTIPLTAITTDVNKAFLALRCVALWGLPLRYLWSNIPIISYQ